MMELFLLHKYYLIVIMAVFFCSIIMQITNGILFKKIMRETNIFTRRNRKELEKFQNDYEKYTDINSGKMNMSIYVDNYIKHLNIGGISLELLRHLSGQLMFIGVALSGIGVCYYMIQKADFLEIIPFYFVCFIGVYLYLALYSLIDIEESKKELKLNLLDYLEHNRRESFNMIWNYDRKIDMKTTTLNDKEKELYQLLSEIFIL